MQIQHDTHHPQIKNHNCKIVVIKKFNQYSNTPVSATISGCTNTDIYCISINSSLPIKACSKFRLSVQRFKVTRKEKISPKLI